MADWGFADWDFRRAVTVDNTKVAGAAALPDFPVLVSVVVPDLRHTSEGGNVGKADGTDILFAAEDGETKLDHELERYDPATGEVVAWVRVPSLAHDADTTLYLYYGHPEAADQQSPADVWDANFRAVWHLGETASAADSIKDSTSHGNHGTPTEFNGGLGVAGQIARGVDLGDEGPERIAVGGSDGSLVAANADGFTWSAWAFRPTAATGTGDVLIVSNRPDDMNWQFGILGGGGGDRKLRFAYARIAIPAHVNVNMTETAILPLDGWHHIALTYTFGTGSSLQWYLDGAPVDGEWITRSGNDAPVSTDDIMIGRAAADGGRWWNGLLDELRVAKTIRSAAWIETEYNNQSDPATFHTLGEEEQSGPPAEGTGSISGGGTLAGVGLALLAGAGLLTGGGALAGVGEAVHSGTGSLSGGGALSGVAAVVSEGTGTLSGGGTLEGAGVAVLQGTGTLEGGGALSGIGQAPSGTAEGTGLLTGGGVLAGQGTAVLGGSGVLSGGGVLEGSGAAVRAGAGLLSGGGELSATAQAVHSGAGFLSGGGELSGVATPAIEPDPPLIVTRGRLTTTALTTGRVHDVHVTRGWITTKGQPDGD